MPILGKRSGNSMTLLPASDEVRYFDVDHTFHTKEALLTEWQLHR
jgi:hypothetical protein